jgi:hypothetical protein
MATYVVEKRGGWHDRAVERYSISDQEAVSVAANAKTPSHESSSRAAARLEATRLLRPCGSIETRIYSNGSKCRLFPLSLMQHTFFGLLTAILALKRPYLTLDLWVKGPPHEIGLSPAVWTGDRLNGGLPYIVGFCPRHASLRCSYPGRSATGSVSDYRCVGT